MKLKEILEKNDNWVCKKEGNQGTDKNTTHSYIDGFYEEALEQYKDKPVSVLEIGIARGDSLLLWDSYFKESKLILGLDNHEQRRSEVKEHNKIKSFIVNAYDVSIVNQLPNFDIIIDDGPHSEESQCFSIEYYLSKLNPGGIFVIEDIQKESSIEVFRSILPDKYKERCKFIDLRPIKNRYDDMMFVVYN